VTAARQDDPRKTSHEIPLRPPRIASARARRSPERAGLSPGGPAPERRASVSVAHPGGSWACLAGLAGSLQLTRVVRLLPYIIHRRGDRGRKLHILPLQVPGSTCPQRVQRLELHLLHRLRSHCSMQPFELA
jgi:hypothetical protein